MAKTLKYVKLEMQSLSNNWNNYCNKEYNDLFHLGSRSDMCSEAVKNKKFPQFQSP